MCEDEVKLRRENRRGQIAILVTFLSSLSWVLRHLLIWLDSTAIGWLI